MHYSEVNCKGERYVCPSQMPKVIFKCFVEKKDKHRIDVTKLRRKRESIGLPVCVFI